MKSYFSGSRISSFFFLVSIFLVVYMPLHVFIVQSVSLLTGGIEVWKAAKDVLVFVLLPLLLYVSYKRGLYKDKTFRLLLLLASAYGLLHGLYLLFSTTDDTYSTIVASVYNTRLLVYLLLGYVVGTSKNAKVYLKYLLTATVLIAGIVAVFGILQYFLPHDILTHVGYTLERGVKPMFFIDDKPDLPRIMSTLKDPNSLGAYLILPILLVGSAVFSKKNSKLLFVRPFRKGILVALLAVLLGALFFTFSRGALLALMISAVTLLCIVKGQTIWLLAKKYLVFIVAFLILLSFFLFLVRNTYTFQNVVFHADESTVLEDPNELRVSLVKNVADDIVQTPQGHGPGTAGLVSISNPKGGVLTENYYLQIAYEVGWLGIGLFVSVLTLLVATLFKMRKNTLSGILLASLAGYLFYSLLIHLWSNEALALQWWLLTGVSLGVSMSKKLTPPHNK